MNLHKQPLTSLISPLFLLIFAYFLIGCSSTPTQEGGASSEKKPDTSLEAVLFSKGGSSLHGSISVAQRGDTWLVNATIWGSPPHESYRIAFFDNGNCSSPNAFSAGKLWAPPETPKDPATWIPVMQTGSEGNASLIARLPNPAQHSLEIFRKRSVLLFVGQVQPLVPSRKNNVVACGVFETPASLIDELL